MNTMIRPTYLLPAALLMLAACSQQEQPLTDPVQGDGERIIFRTSLSESTSRANEVRKDDITNFHVTAFNPDDPKLIADGKLNEFIKDVVLEKDANSGVYASDECLWPERGHEGDRLTFFAYYPDRNEGTALTPQNASAISGNVPNFRYTINKFTVSPDIAAQVDFVTAYATGTMDDNLFSGVSLKFQHKLSRIEVKAKSRNKSCKLEIAGVRLGEVFMQGTYNFKAEEKAGDWTIDQTQGKKSVEYMYRPGDKIVAINNTDTPVSIMGGATYAMLLPGTYNAGWDFANDPANSKKGMYISVLIRVLDKTPGGNDKQQYPYYDNTQGLNALNIPRVYLAVAKATGTVSRQVYKKNRTDNTFFSNEACTQAYTLPATEEVREFGWAAFPVTGNWEAGCYYTYTLDYTSGVGLHDPAVGGGSVVPKAGDPIISDRVGITVSVNDWQGLNGTTTSPIEVPGS